MNTLFSLAEPLDFTPDQKAYIHQEGAIRQICAQFRSHEDGLPEWIKNSSDQYARLNSHPSDSVIVVLLKNGRAGQSPSAVGCLDFGGITAHDLESKFRQWADPTAAGTEQGVEGGHGNGGKCYMTQLFASHAYIHTLKNGRGSKYGFKDGKATPSGYFQSETNGRDYVVAEADRELARALEPFGLTLSDLPAQAQKVWRERQSFTLVAGFEAKYIKRNTIPGTAWMNSLAGHQQMANALARNSVFILYNGRALTEGGQPLKLPSITPIAGAEAIRTVEIPSELIDPDSGELVETGSITGVSRLELMTSDTNMRYQLKARHTISGWTHEGRTTGFWEVPALSRATYSNKIYGNLYLDALQDYKQNDRRNHSPSPLIRALAAWLTQKLDEYSNEFVKQDRIKASKTEQDELSRLNEALNRWKNTFLDLGFGGVGAGDDKGIGTKKNPQQQLPVAPVHRVTLTCAFGLAGRGVTFQPSIAFFGVNNERVHAVPFTLATSDPNILSIDDDLYTITTKRPGHASVWLKCKDSGLQCEPFKIEVLELTSVSLAPSEIEVRVGSHSTIVSSAVTSDGRELTGLYLIWAENDRATVSVSPRGMVVGLQVGKTTITAGDENVEAATPIHVHVVAADDSNGNTGNGFPRILLSEIDADPLGEENTPPRFNSEDPPVMQRAADVNANIWWINMASPLSSRYIDTARGGGAGSREWRVYLLERYIEIMVKLLLARDINQGEELTFDTMLRRWDEQAALMQKHAFESLGSFLDGDDLELAA